MDRSKIIAIVTGAIAIGLSIAYLLIVQILDFRGMSAPAPIGFLWSAVNEQVILRCFTIS